MKSFVPSLYKFILGMFLFGLALWVNPIEGYCATYHTNIMEPVTITTPYSLNSNTSYSFNVPIDDYLIQYGLVPFSSFDCSLGFVFHASGNGPFSYLDYLSVSGYSLIDVDILFSIPGGGAYSQNLGTFALSYSYGGFLGSVSVPLNYNFSSSVVGIPTGFRFTVLNNYLRASSIKRDSNDLLEQISTTFGSTLDISCDFLNFSFDSSSGTGSNTVINNTTSNLVPIGYSSLNFGLNGSTYFLGASHIFEPSYLSPLYFSYDFANSPSGIVFSAPLTLAMGGFDSPPNIAHASPISVIGDTRAGEYELTIALCLSNSPSQAQLSSLTTLSNWGFEFNRGYTGQQFSMPDNARISYTNFTDSKTGYVYTSVYFYFTTPDYFDSFLIRKAPTLNNIRVGAFAFNKYTGTISDQLTQSSQQWDYQNPSHDSFSSANSSAASTVSAFSNIESEAFSNLDTAMSGAGVNDFNINVISTPLATVSAMINQTYNILPDVVKWLLLAILVIGIFAAIISSNNYVNKDP